MKTKRQNNYLVAATLCLAAISSVNGQSITNGSFESQSVSGSYPGSTLYNNSTPLAGWSLPSGTSGDIFVLQSSFVGHGNAYAGSQYASNIAAYQIGSAAYTVISQTVSGFSVGTPYELHYAIADAFGADGITSFMDVLVTDSSGTLASLSDSATSKNGFLDEVNGGSSATDWQLRTLSFTPTRSTVTFSFDLTVPSSSQVYSAGLDSVSVNAAAVPEASSALLGAIGAVALLRRRRA